jgi:glycosyltransferase involved in cell wall biosynthesis
MDAVVVHSAHGQRRLVQELGVDKARIHVIAHGVLEPWQGIPEQSLPESLRDVRGPVVLFFGLLRPYKGLEVLLDAWRGIEGAELWIVGMPRMDISELRSSAPANVRFVTGFIADAQIPGLMRRASFVVLPYHEIDQSGVLFTALGKGAPLLLSDVGGFPEVALSGAARTFKAGDSGALRTAIDELLADPSSLAQMAEQAKRVAQTDYSWAQIADRTLGLYERLLDR